MLNREHREHRQHQPHEILERGEIFFLCPPKPDATAARKDKDVISFFLLMHQEHAENHRLLHVGQKKDKKDRGGGKHYWGVVYEIVETARHFDELLGDRDYASARRCARDMMMMQPSGMGEYQVQRQGDCTYLSYALLPQLDERALLTTMQIPAAANYLIRAKNPNPTASPASPSPAQGENRNDARTAALCQHVQRHFAGRPFINVDPPQLLDYEGLEILFLGMDTHMDAPPNLSGSHVVSEPNDLDMAAECAAAEQDADTVFAALRMPPAATATVRNASSLRTRWH